MRSFREARQDAFGKYKLGGYKKIFQRISSRLPKSTLAFKIALVLRKLALLNRVQVVDVKSLWGLKMRLYPLDNVGDRLVLFMPWYFDWEEFKILDHFLKKGDVFLDIGANTGYYSFLASSIIEDSGRVIALEPNPVMFARLEFNLKLNGFDEKIERINLGLADSSGIYDLSIDPKNLGRSSIIQSYGKHSVSIQCITLLELINQLKLDRIDFLKIDVEMAESLILRPFFESAKKEVWPKMILIETTEGIPFAKLGYQQIRCTKNNTLFELN